MSFLTFVWENIKFQEKVMEITIINEITSKNYKKGRYFPNGIKQCDTKLKSKSKIKRVDYFSFHKFDLFKYIKKL